MLDIKLIREELDETIERLNLRNKDFSYLRDVYDWDVELRQIKTKVEGLKAKRNENSKLIGQYKREKKDVSEIMKNIGNIGDEIKELDNLRDELDAKVTEALLTTPNVPHPKAIQGLTEDDNVEIRNAIATVFLKNKYGLDDIATITTKEKQIAEQIKDIISPIFADYGVAIEKFFIERFMYDEDFLQMLNKIKKDSILKNLEFDLDKGLRKDQRKESVKTAKVPSEDFAFCNECGHKNPGTAKFCSNCGSKM